MAQIDRDLDEILVFCRKFKTGYLATLQDNANRLKTIASSSEASLGGTKFSTNATAKLMEAAQKLIKAAQSGEELIREIEHKAKAQEREKSRIEDLCR